MDVATKSAFLTIVVVTFLASFHLVPVSLHMLLVTVSTVYIGSRFALKCWKIEAGSSGVVSEDADGNEIHRPAGEQMQTRDAMMFPVIGSCVLFSLYCVYKFLPKEWVNLVIKAYFFIFGCLVLAQKLAQILSATLPEATVHQLLAVEYSAPNPTWAFERVEQALMPVLRRVPGLGYNEPLPEGEEAPAPSEPFMPLSLLDLLALAAAVCVSILYVATGSWICSNAFGIAFSVQGIEMLSLGSFFNGCILLCGLFIYDVFWVFGTDVMVTVAKSFDAPIKLLFPQFAPFGVEEIGSPSMLGLGDIVIPGIFVALLLRYDIWRQVQRVRGIAERYGRKLSKKESHNLDCLYCHMEKHGRTLNPIYFTSNLIAYVSGLAITVAVMYTFKAAQPALLYLVPACLGTSIVLALVRGDMRTLWNYTENEEAEETKDTPAPTTNDADVDAAVDEKEAASKEEEEEDAPLAESQESVDASSAAAAEEEEEAAISTVATEAALTQRTSGKKKRSVRAD